jgi:AcrR family transcriptional regulator
MSDKREAIVDAALALFQRQGFHATGIDRILAESGAAKMTLYKHFRSKDELVLAALRRCEETFRAWFEERVRAAHGGPRRRLLAVFDVADEWFRSPAFCGCLFINAAAEFGGAEAPARRAAAEAKAATLAFLRELAAEAGAPDPDELARQLNLLLQGAIVMAHAGGDRDAAQAARRAAAALVKAGLEKPGGAPPHPV